MDTIIHSSGYYVHVHNNKPELVAEVSKATQFSYGCAKRFISNQIAKKHRGEYIIQQISEPPDFLKNECSIAPIKINRKKASTPKPLPPEIEKTHNETIAFAEHIKGLIHARLDKSAEKLRKQLHEYEDKICDYRHFIRDTSNRFNGVELCRAAKYHKQLEHERSETKKELQRVQKMLDSADKLLNEVITFDYEEYKPRTNIDFMSIIKGYSD